MAPGAGANDGLLSPLPDCFGLDERLFHGLVITQPAPPGRELETFCDIYSAEAGETKAPRAKMRSRAPRRSKILESLR